MDTLGIVESAFFDTNDLSFSELIDSFSRPLENKLTLNRKNNIGFTALLNTPFTSLKSDEIIFRYNYNGIYSNPKSVRLYPKYIWPIGIGASFEVGSLGFINGGLRFNSSFISKSVELEVGVLENLVFNASIGRVLPLRVNPFDSFDNYDLIGLSVSYRNLFSLNHSANYKVGLNYSLLNGVMAGGRTIGINSSVQVKILSDFTYLRASFRLGKQISDNLEEIQLSNGLFYFGGIGLIITPTMNRRSTQKQNSYDFENIWYY